MRTPTMAELLEISVKKGLIHAHMSMPAEVTTVYLDKNMVDVKPKTKIPIRNQEGEIDGISIAIIRSVPIQYPGGGGFRLTFPVAVGDPCWLIFGDYSLDTWKSAGVEGKVEDIRYHHLTDAVAIFGIRPFDFAVTSPADGMTMGKEGGPQVKATATAIELGGNTDAAVKGNVYRTAEGVANGSIQSALTAIATGFGTLAVHPALGGSPALPVPTLAAAAAGGAAAASAIGTLEAGAASYLSNTVKVI